MLLEDKEFNTTIEVEQHTIAVTAIMEWQNSDSEDRSHLARQYDCGQSNG